MFYVVSQPDDQRYPQNLMTTDPSKVWPNGIVYYDKYNFSKLKEPTQLRHNLG